MSESTACPVCGSEEWWSVLVTTQQGVKLPGESQAASDEETSREVALCDGCGVCYDPMLADGVPRVLTAGSEAESTEGVREDVEELRHRLVAVETTYEHEADVQQLRERVADVEQLREQLDDVETLAERAETVEELTREVERLENALQVVAGVQAGMADAAPQVEQSKVLEALSNTDVLPDHFE